MSIHSIVLGRPFSKVGSLVRAANDQIIQVPAPPHGMLRLIGEASEGGGYVNLDQTIRIVNPAAPLADVQARIVTADGSFLMGTHSELGAGEIFRPDGVSLGEDESLEIALLSTSDPGATINAFINMVDTPDYNIGRQRIILNSSSFVDVIPAPRLGTMHVPLGFSNEEPGPFGCSPVGGGGGTVEAQLVDADGTPFFSGTEIIPFVIGPGNTSRTELDNLLFHLNAGQRMQMRLAEGGPVGIFSRWMIVGAPSRDL